MDTSIGRAADLCLTVIRGYALVGGGVASAADAIVEKEEPGALDDHARTVQSVLGVDRRALGVGFPCGRLGHVPNIGGLPRRPKVVQQRRHGGLRDLGGDGAHDRPEVRQDVLAVSVGV
jgi:hypothetical protein